MITMSYFFQPQVILVGSELTKMSEESAAKILKQELGFSTTPIFSCITGQTLLAHKREGSALDGMLKLPLDRMQFERALDQFCEKNKISRKKVA